MGHKRKATVYELEFAEFKDDDGQPLTVWVKSVPIGRLLNLVRLAGLANMGDNDRKLSEEDIKNVEELFKVFAKSLIKWNLEEPVDPDDEGDWRPVPATYDAVMSQDIDFMLQIVLRWVQTISNVTESLGKGSTSGQRFPEGHGQTVPPSLNLESLMRPSSS